jgi:hypothetical protein
MIEHSSVATDTFYRDKFYNIMPMYKSGAYLQLTDLSAVILTCICDVIKHGVR